MSTKRYEVQYQHYISNTAQGQDIRVLFLPNDKLFHQRFGIPTYPHRAHSSTARGLRSQAFIETETLQGSHKE